MSLNEEARLVHESNIMRTLGDESIQNLHSKQYKAFYDRPGTNGIENVAYQLRMMDKFVIPPQFDFVLKDIECADVSPFVQYIFQFRTDFTREDLASMWQNMYPVSSTSAATAKHSTPFSGFVTNDTYDTEYISNYLDVDNTLIFRSRTSNYENVEEFLENEVRWLVFKVKQRAINDYQEIVLNSMSPEAPGNIQSINNLTEIPAGKKSTGGQVNTKKKKHVPGFNWPYDYFSLVELGKLESKIDFYDDRTAVGSPEKVPAQRQETQFESFISLTRDREIPDDIARGASSQFEIVSTPTTSDSTTSSGASVASAMVFREALLTSSQTPTSRVFNISGPLSAGTEQVFRNGVLQTQGAGDDYVISGQTLTFNFDLEAGDDIAISYVKG